ncbi:MAG TPA: hypothetical protein VGV87_25245 [Blastocatellia bacterium]|nr:hypothetical protein [Blastocatellia bacterium]
MNRKGRGSTSLSFGHVGWRRIVLLFTAAFFVAWFPFRGTPAAWSVVLIAITSLSLSALILASLSARQFGQGEPARLLWWMVALIGLTDTLVAVAFTLPGVVGMFKAAGVFTVVTTAIGSLSRIALAVALWMMIRVYRKGGLTVHLEKLDYAAIAIFAGVAVMSVILSGSVVRATLYISSPNLINWVRLAGIPSVVALVGCSVFGVMAWKYARQMGGGLVAKASRSIMVYAFLWVFRLGLLGALSYVYAMDPLHRPTWVRMIDFASILGAEYFLFLSASYQHEACTSDVVFDETEMEAFAQTFGRPLA